jgi:adenylate cyclase
MTEQRSRPGPRVIARAVRIVTGLVLLAFVTTHLLNGSLGLHSVKAMEDAMPYLTGIWSNTPLQMLIMLSLIAHFALGLWSIYMRPTLRTNAQDMVQILTALLVVPVMATHVIGISMAQNYGLTFGYAETISLMWIDAPAIGLLQVIVVTVVWIHGCAGLLTWLRAIEGARTLVLWFYPIAIAVPVLALLGFSEAGRQVLEAADVAETAYSSDTYSYSSNDNASNGYVTADDAPAPEVNFSLIKAMTNWMIWGSLALAGLTLALRALRNWVRPHAEMVLVRDDLELKPLRTGPSALDGFRMQNVGHASLCEGRGRCGTCAVHILSSEFPLPPVSDLERRTLLKKGLPDDARLACQIMPDGGRIEMRALYPAEYSYHDLDDDPADDEPAQEVMP